MLIHFYYSKKIFQEFKGKLPLLACIGNAKKSPTAMK